nr:hypothetical protein [uncultured Undibacterium sp.]
MSDIKRFDEVPNEFGDYEIEEAANGEYMLYGVHVAAIKELEEQLAKVTARYNCVRDMTPEQFENTSTIHEDFDSQVDAMIKEQGK